MPFNGLGSFTRIYSWAADAAAGIDITASRMDTDSNDIATNGLSNCLTRDGQGQPTANLPMASFKHTGAAIATASTDYVTLGQVTVAGSLAMFATDLTLTNNGTSGKKAVNFSQFLPHLAVTGYIDLPGGVTINWGQGTGPAVTITYGKAFSSTPWNLQATPAAVAAGGATGGVQITSTVSATQANIVTVSSAGVGVSMQFYWMAIGPT